MPQKLVFFRIFSSDIIARPCNWQKLFLAGPGKCLYDGTMKRFLHSFAKISPAGLLGVRIVLALCCAMAFGAFLLCLFAGEPRLASFRAYRLAQALAQAPAGVLLLAGIALIILESPRG